MGIVHRPADPDDADFVVSTWSRSFKPSRSSGMIANDDWASVMAVQIRNLVARPDVLTVVACDADEPNFLYGFIAAIPATTPPVVFYCYVKEPYRRAGCARALLESVGIDPAKRFAYTCWTPVVPKLRDVIPQAVHIPEYARNPGYVEQARTHPWKR